MLTATLDCPGLRAFRRQLAQGGRASQVAFRQTNQQAGIIAAREVRQRAPSGRSRATGGSKLRDTIGVRASGSGVLFTQTVYAGAGHALYVERGTRAHVIRPRQRKALRFYAGGKLVFATVVNHPGTRGRYFFARGMSAAGRLVEREYQGAMGDVLRGLSVG